MLLTFILGVLWLLESLAISSDIINIEVFAHPAFGYARVGIVLVITTVYTLSSATYNGKIIEKLSFSARIKLWAYNFVGMTVAIGFLSAEPAIRYGMARVYDHVPSTTPMAPSTIPIVSSTTPVVNTTFSHSGFLSTSQLGDQILAELLPDLTSS